MVSLFFFQSGLTPPYKELLTPDFPKRGKPLLRNRKIPGKILFPGKTPGKVFRGKNPRGGPRLSGKVGAPPGEKGAAKENLTSMTAEGSPPWGKKNITF